MAEDGTDASVAKPGPDLLWAPSAAAIEESSMTAYMRWLEAERGLRFADYAALWDWSSTEIEAFWASIWDYFGVISNGKRPEVLASREMPPKGWFAGAEVSYPEHVFRDRDDDAVALVSAAEGRELAELPWGELKRQVAALASGLRSLGVERGDRVAAYLPNIAEAVVGFLATASVGAIWSSCSPDFGAGSVVDRFAQIEPKVLLCVDGYRYGGREFDRRDVLAGLQEAMPSLERTVVVPYLDPDVDLSPLRDAITWGDLLASGAGAELAFERVPFEHPLWVLYSSGTTGLPKPIVQSQGGILIEHLKKLNLHVDLREGDRLFWFTTTGWMMWNFLVSGLLSPASIALYDGNPGYPDMSVLWDLAADAGITTFGTSASFVAACMKEGVKPGGGRDLSALRALGSTGSPLSPEGFDWIYEELGADTWLFSTSGGTDVCTAFVGGVPILPVYRGELQGRALGARVEAYDDAGRPVIDTVGELVITAPMPSMPVFFWGDEDGSRYHASYFEHFPGVWRHGDWIEITSRDTAIIYGRSDSTINRGGIRMGTSEIYRAVAAVDQVTDSLVIDLPRPGTEGWMPLFVVLREGVELDADLTAEIKRRIRTECSPRHVPNEIIQIEEVPRTLSGKVLEVPVKRILMGTPVDRAASRDSLANPAALDWFVEYASRST
ncbi:MAG: acetoacetyl-CoA synthetase [Solirubrobacterales bacterium]|nr:acetoacetyl-CoA synthetase [Solirubrobacterales bacterium]